MTRAGLAAAGSRRRLTTLLAPVLVSAALISAVVVTLGAPLIPVIHEYYGVSSETAQWSYTVTLLIGAIATPLLGRLADGKWRRLAMILASGSCALGCFICAVTDSFATFLAGRGLQGLGVSLVAMTIASARSHLPAARSASVIAFLSITTALGAGIAYPVSTFIADRWGMPTAFWCAGAIAGLVTLMSVGLPRSEAERLVGRIDFAGPLLLVCGVTSGLLAISMGNTWGWASAPTLGLAATAMVLLAVWARVELRVENPLIDLRLLRDRDVQGADITALLMGISLYSTPVLIARIAQASPSTGYGVGLSLTATGLIMIPIAFGNFLGSRVVRWARRRGLPRVPLALGGLSAVTGALLMMAPNGTVWQLVLAMSLSAVGAGCTFGAMPGMIVASVAPGETGSATSFNILLRTVGGTIGSALTAAMLGLFPASGGSETLLTGFQIAFLVCACASTLSVVVSLIVPKSRVSAPLPAATTATMELQ